MSQEPSVDRSSLRLAGIAGILAGGLILTFAIAAGSHGVLFEGDILEGAPVDPWMRNVLVNPKGFMGLLALPMLGFACMQVVMGVLRRSIREESWQKTLAVVGYNIGVPVAIVAFSLQLCLMNEVRLADAGPEHSPLASELVARLVLQFFHVVNHFVGPFFIIGLGTTMMAWAALRTKALPKWICRWLIACGAMVFLSLWSPLLPALKPLGIFAPLHMLGFILLGVILLRRSACPRVLAG